MEAAGDGGPLDDGVLGKIIKGEECAAFAELVDQLVGHFAAVEGVRIGGNALQGVSEGRLGERLASLVELAVALEDAFGVGKFGQVGITELFGLLGAEDEAAAGKLDRWSHDACETELAVLALGVNQAGDRAGRGNGAVADDARLQAVAGEDVALRVLVHGFSGGKRGLLAVVDERCVAVVGAEQKKAAAAKVAGRGMDHGERKAGGDSGVDGVAAGSEGLKAGVGGEMVNADDYAVLSADWLLVQIGDHFLCGLLGGDLGDLSENGGDGERGAGEGGQDGEDGRLIHVF